VYVHTHVSEEYSAPIVRPGDFSAARASNLMSAVKVTISSSEEEKETLTLSQSASELYSSHDSEYIS
jgi:hypothetical protein